MANLFANIPVDVPEELFHEITNTDAIRIERIISDGRTTPQGNWYDQEEHEWVLVLKGCGVIEFADGRTVTLNTGDYLTIPAHDKHRVASTSDSEQTIWLAIFYR